MERYSRNMNMLSLEENESLKNFKVCVIGCGGLGGYIIEMLGRLGIGYITAVDGDAFEESNLNRQLLSDSSSLGKSKAYQAQARMSLVNPNITMNPIAKKIDKINAEEIIYNHDIVIDAVDNIETRFLIQEVAASIGIPMIYGAIAGWYGQVCTIFPGDNTLDKIYPDKNIKGLEEYMGNPSFTPAMIASIQVSEALKVLLKKGNLIRNKLMYIDLLEGDCTIIDF